LSSKSGIIDSHVHIGRSVYGPELSVGDCLKLMGKYGVERALVSCFTPEDLDFVKANREVERVVDESGGMLAMALRLDPRQRARSAELLRGDGFSAVMLNPFEQSFRANEEHFLSPIMARAEQLGVPVIIEGGYPVLSTPLQVGDLATRYPMVSIVMTHAGQLLSSGQAESDALAAMSDNPNLFADTSLLTLTGIGGFLEQASHLKATGRRSVKAKKELPSPRLVFGSECPLSNIGVELSRVRWCSEISEDEKMRILRDNAIELFGL
jgi:predicted TIM-barrel fold metal-dependent hydrolase